MFDGKAAVVTGAANGIGRATALAFGGEGVAVVAADIDGEGAERTAAAVRDAGGRAAAVRTDVASAEDVAGMVRAAVDTFGRLDFAVNNAGIVGGGATIEDMPLATWQRGIDVMLTGVFLGMKYEIPALRRQGGGAIVNVSSGAGIIGFPGMADYVSSKHAVLGLTKTAALECTEHNIRVNAVCPGTARTKMVEDWMQGDEEAEAQVRGMHPIGRIADPAEIAAAILWLCSDASSFVLGHALVTDGGYTIQ